MSIGRKQSNLWVENVCTVQASSESVGNPKPYLSALQTENCPALVLLLFCCFGGGMGHDGDRQSLQMEKYALNMEYPPPILSLRSSL